MAKKSKPIDLKQETADISAKTAASYEKLAGKFQQKAQHAAVKAKDAKGGEEEILHRRRFDLYSDCRHRSEGPPASATRARRHQYRLSSFSVVWSAVDF